ncbi:MAG: thiamine phosphate synthase [Chloroflexi bacterium]|nr:thiamine phosphate synthase [Chloroflexota bacterium]
MASDDAADKAYRAELLARMTRSGLYLVTDDRLPADVLVEKLTAAIQAGADVVQFRDKRTDRAAVWAVGRRVAETCRSFGALFIVNDDAELAAEVQADGIHVGQEDAPPSDVRRVVGPRQIIGLSVSHLHEADDAAVNPDLDYIGFGALYGTPTKPDAEPAGPDMLAEARTKVSFPIVGIGGITARNLGPAFAAGADSVAVVSAVFSAPDPAAATRDLLAAIAEARKGRT